MKTNIEPAVWDKMELISRDELTALQTKRLKETLARTRNVPFYKKALAKKNIEPEDIKSPEDITKLPFTTKADLRDNYPLGFLAVNRDRVIRFHGSSGTTGKPTFVAYTKEDIDTWSGLCARFLTAGGIRPGHTVQVAFGYGLFTGGFGLHYGIEKLGAAVIPASSGNTARQIMLMRDMQTDALVCTPSYALNIAETIQAEKTDKPLALKFAHLGGEPWTEDMRKEIENQLGVRAFNNYGLSEVIGPGVSGECPVQSGMHIQEDHFIVECVDPDTLEPVEPGNFGELVFTSLTKQAMPIIRYRTRDIAKLDPTPCPCGRTGIRMSRITGRTDDMLIIRGVNVFPSQIEEALLRVDGTAPHYLIEVDRTATMDEVTIHVEINPRDFSDKMSQMHELKSRIDHKIFNTTGLRMKINLVDPKKLERFSGKAKRVIDHRSPITP